MRAMTRIIALTKEIPEEHFPFTVGRHGKKITSEYGSILLRTQNLRASLETSKDKFLLFTASLPPHGISP